METHIDPGAGLSGLCAGDTLPQDGTAGALLARIWNPVAGGPSPAAVRAGGVYDVSATFPTVAGLCEEDDPAAALGATGGLTVGIVDDLLAATVGRPA
ncbi:hypothetical protein ACFFNX_47730, partial [Actinoallomurus acaciae]